jgi:hypothetical protein
MPFELEDKLAVDFPNLEHAIDEALRHDDALRCLGIAQPNKKAATMRRSCGSK